MRWHSFWALADVQEQKQSMRDRLEKLFTDDEFCIEAAKMLTDGENQRSGFPWSQLTPDGILVRSPSGWAG